MSCHFERLLSENAKGLKKSAIRELLKLTAKPNIISFAGGLPHPDTFPIENIKNIVNKILSEEGPRILQYSTTEGDQGLKQQLCDWLSKDNIQVKPENMIVTSASQQGLDLVSKLFLNPGDSCIVGLPTYLGFLQASNSVRSNPVGVELDEEGIKTDVVKEEIERLIAEGNPPKFIYVVPDFQNPTGVTMSLNRRKHLLEIAKNYNILIVEDTPYRSLRYRGESVPTVYQLDNNEGNVITLYTFSKIFIPGFRLGWIISSRDIIDRMVLAKQGMDLCTSLFTQTIARDYIKLGLLEKRIKENIKLYSRKMNIMLDALQKYMPKIEGLKWTKPDGGLFLWITLPENISADRMFYDAIEENVAYVVGSAFHCDEKGHNTMRLNFSFPDEDKIDIGIQRLANVIKKEKEKKDNGLDNNIPLSP